MTEPTAVKAAIIALTSEWCRHLLPYAQDVVDVQGDGSDWNGDTEGGFYSTFALEIRFRSLEDGQLRWAGLVGSQAADLWNFILTTPLPSDTRCPTDDQAGDTA